MAQGKSTVSRRREKIKQQQKRQQQQAKLIRIGAGVLTVVALLAIGYLVWQGKYTEAQEESNNMVNGSGTLMESDRPLAEMDPAARNNYYTESPEMVIDTDKAYEAVVRTDKGDMLVNLFTEDAPKTVNNFVFLANQGFYDGVVFHRVLEGFMAQGGDPSGSGRGGPGYRFEDETDNGLTFDRPGLLAMANAGPNTNGSQFFITFVPTPHLNGAHTIFGEVVEGNEVLSQITRRQPGAATPADVINRVDIYEAEN